MSPPTLPHDRLARAQHPTSAAQSLPESLARPSSSSAAFARSGRGASTASSSSRAGRGAPEPTSSTRGGRSVHFDTRGGGPATDVDENPGHDKDEMWEERQRREKAAAVLGSWEMLCWYAVAGNESIPQTRLRFQRMMIGLPDAERREEWEDEKNPGDEDDEAPRKRVRERGSGVKKKR